MPAIKKSYGNAISHSLGSGVNRAHASVEDTFYLQGNEFTDGSIRQKQIGQSFQLQKRILGTWTTVQDSTEEQTILRKSIKTGVGSVHLGDIHSEGSAGENVIFRNENTNVCWFPVWQGIMKDGSIEYIPQCRTYGTLSTYLPVGSVAASGSLDATLTTAIVANTSFFSANVVAAEAYTGKLTWSVKYLSGLEISGFIFSVSTTVGGSLSIPFVYPLDIRTGSTVMSTLTKEDGTLLKIRPSASQPTQVWRSLVIRPFSDSNVFHYANIEEVFSNDIPLADSFTVGSAGVAGRLTGGLSRADHKHPRESIPVVQRFTTAGAATYTPTAGMRYCIIEAYGAGAAGGTTSTATIVQVSGAGAGGSGGYTKVMATATQVGVSLALTIGAKGVATATPNSTGPSGGNTIVGSMFTCGGGSGGQSTSAIIGATGAAGGVGGAGGVDSAVTGCTFLEGIDGERGDNTLIVGGAIINGRGGSTQVGRGGYPGGTVTGSATTATNGNGIGAGGGGAAVNGLSGSRAGGSGSDGAVIVTEYF